MPYSIITRLFNRKAALFMQANIHEDSVELLSKKAIELAELNNDKNLAAVSSNELGYLYLNKIPTNPKAEEYLKKAVKIWNDLDYKIYEVNARINLSRYYERIEDYDKGLKTLEEFIMIVDSSSWNWEKGAFYERLSNLYGKKEQFKKAYYYSNLSKEILLHFNESQYNQQLSILSIKLEVQKKEEELLKKQIEIDRAKIEYESTSKENKILYTSLFIIFIVFIIMLFI